MATAQQPLINLDTFKGDFKTTKLVSRLSDRILDQYEARTQATSTNRFVTRQTNTLPTDTIIAMDQLLMQFERADRDLQELKRQLDDRLYTLSNQVGKAEESFQAQVTDFEDSVGALNDDFTTLDQKMSSVTSIATRFGDMLQSTDSFRSNAEEAIRIILAFQEFASAEKMRDLSEVFQSDSSLLEAAALTRKIVNLANEVTKADERVSTAHTSTSNGKNGKNNAEKGTIEFAKQQVDRYQQTLENKVIARFDKAETKKDTEEMAACALILQELERANGTSLVQRYISSRSMFTDPRELALGQSEPVVDTNTALAAKRRLGTMYKSIIHSVRNEVSIMKAVFPRPQEAITAFVQHIFEKRIETVLSSMLSPPTIEDVNREMLEAYLKLLAEAYQSSCNLAKNLQEHVGEGADVMELVEGAFTEILTGYTDLEKALLRLQYRLTPNVGPVGVLLQDPVIQYCKWSQDALERATALLHNPLHRGDFVRSTVHNSTSRQADVGCLFEQVAIHLVHGLGGALQQCLRHSGPAYGTASLANMQRATVRQAALRVAEQGIGPVLGAISQASSIVKTVQAHYMKVVEPLLEDVPQIAQTCSKGFAAMLRAVEDRIISTLDTAISDFFATAGTLLANEQKRADFKPSDEVPAPLDIPTDACLLVSSLLAAVLQEASQTLQASNLVSFNAEIGMRTHKLLCEHMQRFTFSSTGVLRWKRDVTEYCEALHSAISSAASVQAAFEDLKEAVNLLVVAPESLLALVDSSVRFSSSHASQYVKLREDFKTARVKGKSLAQLLDIK